MKIPLTKGLETEVDEVDFIWASQWNWAAGTTRQGKTYVVRTRRKSEQVEGEPNSVYLHTAHPNLGAIP